MINYGGDTVDSEDKVKTSITLDKDVYDAISELAIEDDRKFSPMVNKILKEYLKNIDKEAPK